MKRILFLLLIVLTSNLIFAQDIIVKQSGDEIKSEILEITSETIKYKEFESQDGPTRNINISDVFMVIYESGKREKFTTTESQTSNGYKDNYFTLGTGVGNSYGVFGLRGQWRWRMGGNQGFGIHFGAGYGLETPIVAAAGVKFFPYKDFYINAQFGLTGVEEYTYIVHRVDQYGPSDDYIDYWYENIYTESHVLYGPSFLVGGDFNWGSKVGYGFNAGLGISYNFNAVKLSSEVVLALDLGFIVRF